MKTPDERIGLYVPTRGHVWHGTAAQLAYIGIMAEIGLPLYIRGVTGAAEVRNEIVKAFLASGKDVLVMVDDDVVPPKHMLQIVDPIEQGDAEIVAAPVPIIRPNTMFLPNIFSKAGAGYEPSQQVYDQSGLVKVDAVGTGCIAIARKVLEDHHMKQPFRPKLTRDGVWQMGEDVMFCERARARGYRIMADLDVWCEHLVEVHANGVAMAYMGLLMAQQEEIEQLQEMIEPLEDEDGLSDGSTGDGEDHPGGPTATGPADIREPGARAGGPEGSTGLAPPGH